MPKMKALKTFLVHGDHMPQGEIFTTTEARAGEYETLQLAERLTADREPDELKEAETAEEQNIEDAPVYGEMTVRQLKKIANEKNIEGASTMKKADLLEALYNQETQQNENKGDE